MISADDIDAFKEDADTFDRVNKRVMDGVTEHREMRANEVIPYMRHAIRIQSWLNALLDERRELAASAMHIGEPEAKYLEGE